MTCVNQKDWGWTEALHDSAYHFAARIDVKAGGFCSQHKHLLKWNGFSVVRGRMVIEIWNAGSHLSDPPDTSILLGPGDYYSVPPGQVHRFYCDVPTCAMETYWSHTTVREDDIVRLSLGGIRK